MGTASSIKTTLLTSHTLIDQFLSSLELPTDSASSSASHPSPLHLLNAAATSLKSSVTKLSLLTITTPFTPSAIVSTLQPLNNSILPSLVTATLLTSPTWWPKSFCQECTALTRAVLRDLQQLLLLIKSRSEDGKPKAALTDRTKQQVTETTGKVWEDCDLLLKFAKDDVGGFVATKAKQWLDLMKDAVKELEDWDPEEEDVDDQDWLGLDDGARSDDDDTIHGAENPQDTGPGTDRATISAGIKDQALKVLSRIPQSIHVVIKQRLEKFSGSHSQETEATEPMLTAHRRTLDLVVRKTRAISECIDESAEALYLGNPELYLKKAGEARALTIRVVEAVLDPWAKQDTETKEDQYVKKALIWIQQVSPTATTSNATAPATIYSEDDAK